MKLKIDYDEYDTLLLCTDWRDSAAIVGMIKYYKYCEAFLHIERQYKEVSISSDTEFNIDCKQYMGFQGIAYNSKSINEENYLRFVEYFYGEDLQHFFVEKKISMQDYDEETIKVINSKLTGTDSNVILKKHFKGIKFDGENSEEVLDIINENRLELIKETYRNKSRMYRKYANTNMLLKGGKKHCRLLGYSVDENRKSKSASYYFNVNTFDGNDYIEYDFIPFAFSRTYDSVFVNNNFSIKLLLQTNDAINKIFSENSLKSNVKLSLLEIMSKSKDYVANDIEVIIRSRDKDIYETLYIRDSAVNAMKNIESRLNKLNFNYEISKGNWLKVQNEVADICINSLSCDYLIETLLKLGNKDDVNKFRLENVINILIDFSIYLKGEYNMETQFDVSKEDIEKAKICGKKVMKEMKEKNRANKIVSYRQKLTSSLVFHDYDRVCEILLQLSAYSNVEMNFVYKLYENPEENKELAFAFTSALIDNKQNVENEAKKG